MYLGSWKIDDLLTFPANTHRFDTGAGTDADAVPDYRVYEDETSTPILTGSMALLDSANTAGFYTERITLSAANGFEKGKCYTIYIAATVNAITATMSHTFQIEAEVDANIVSDKTGYRLSSTGVDDILDDPLTEPSGVFAWGSATLRNVLAWLGALSSNEIRQTSSTQTLRNRADNATIASAGVSDDGTTATRDSFT